MLGRRRGVNAVPEQRWGSIGYADFIRSTIRTLQHGSPAFADPDAHTPTMHSGRPYRSSPRPCSSRRRTIVEVTVAARTGFALRRRLAVAHPQVAEVPIWKGRHAVVCSNAVKWRTRDGVHGWGIPPGPSNLDVRSLLGKHAAVIFGQSTASARTPYFPIPGAYRTRRGTICWKIALVCWEDCRRCHTSMTCHN